MPGSFPKVFPSVSSAFLDGKNTDLNSRNSHHQQKKKQVGWWKHRELLPNDPACQCARSRSKGEKKLTTAESILLEKAHRLGYAPIQSQWPRYKKQILGLVPLPAVPLAWRGAGVGECEDKTQARVSLISGAWSLALTWSCWSAWDAIKPQWLATVS